MSGKTESSLEEVRFEDPNNRKLFDNYGPVNLRETVGTFFLGVLAILLLIALQRFWNDYKSLFGERPGYK